MRTEVRLSSLAAAFLLVFTLCTQPSASAQSAEENSRISGVLIPFVGCKSDGQVGPLKAPAGKSKLLAISASAAWHLAFYKAESGPGVLAPRGWHCFGTYGSNGENLYVYPEPIDTMHFFSDTWSGFSGPAVQFSSVVGDTSGRFEVARVIARVFPEYTAFVNKVIDEGIEPASDFPLGAYPHDVLFYKTKSIVEYETPAETEGLGTNSSLRKNDQPIRGVAILVGETPGLWSLSVRLPANLSALTPAIVDQVERAASSVR